VRGGWRNGGWALAALLVAAPLRPDDAVDVVIAKDGFRPSTLRVRRGDTLKLRVRSADEEHCFALDQLRIEKRVLPGATVLVEVTPDRAGTFRFHCCLEDADTGPHGDLVVSD
jgi:hypothetical protein